MVEHESNILAGDIGGTKTNLAIFSSKPGIIQPLFEATFSSKKYPNLEMLTLDFLSQTKLSIAKASFCVPGPVVKGRAEITNLAWVIEEDRLVSALGISPVYLHNDLLAFANAVPLLKKEDTYLLNQGDPDHPGGVKLILAPGTGLGQAYLAWNGNRYCAHPSEGGHADFAPTNAVELGLLNYLLKQFNHVSYERVCSGIGLPNIYGYLKKIGQYQEPEWLTQILANSDNPATAITNAALDSKRPCALCHKTLEVFVSILGAAAGSAALHMMALGGVYLGGGIPPRILPLLKKNLFMQGFIQKGRFTQLMSQIPVHVILNPKVAMFGAAILAQ